MSKAASDSADKAIRALAERCDKVIDLQYKPRPWQALVHKMRKRFSVLVCHRRAGKTVMAVMELIDKALKLTKQDGRYAYIAPFKHQAKDVAWSYLKMYGSRVPGTTINETECFIEFNKKQTDGSVLRARIKIYGADDPDSLRGSYLDGVVLDEVAQMKAYVWGEVIRPMLSDRQGWVIFLGTPKGINLLSELYYFATDENERAKGDEATNKDWYGKIFTVYETNGAVPPEEVADCKRTQTERQFRQEYMCDFNAGSEDTLLAVDDIMDSVERFKHRDLSDWSVVTDPVIMGVDVASSRGKDYSAICVRQGALVLFLRRYKDYGQVQLVEEIIRVNRMFGCDCVNIDGTGGYGGGVVEQVKLRGLRANDIQFGSRTQLIDKKFLNKRAEIWWRMAEWIKLKGMIPDDKTLHSELAAVRYWHNGSGMLQIMAKEDMEHSPDSGDALALTHAYDVTNSINPFSKHSMILAEGFGLRLNQEENCGGKYNESRKFNDR